RQAIADALDRLDGTHEVDQVLAALADQALILEVAEGRWRSRLAETLRLLVHARQLFTTGGGEWWLRGRRLISGFRLLAQPRRYPKRDVSPQSLLDRVQTIQALTPLGRQVLAAQIHSRPLAQFQVDATAAVLESLHSDGTQAVIVGAGTGGGKTLAVYLPAYLWMAENLGG